MNTLNQKYERYLMFMNDPMLQAGTQYFSKLTSKGFEENDLDIKERIGHIQLKPVDIENKSMSFQPRQKQLLSGIQNINNDVSANELRNILVKVDEMEKRIVLMGNEY
jgi:hypothetical protein